MNAGKVGCIGLGNMGGGIAANIIKAGYNTTVFDIRTEAMSRFRELGAATAATPADAGRDASILCVTVLNDADLESALLGDDGALGTMPAGSVVVVHSTIAPDTCRRMSAAAARTGVRFVDAPISGGAEAAADGTLTLMIGGADEVVATCAGVFDAISARRFHVGGVGAGQIAKLVNNLMSIVNRIAVGEGLALARKGDLREDTVLDLLRASSGNSWQVEHWRSMQAVASTSTTGAEGMAAMARKDLGLVLELAREYQLAVPLTEISYDNTDALFTENG
jgi:3-hydroxyisobutyrate dehydrogenase-like beta-hydroxyacid dehydrogenase